MNPYHHAAGGLKSPALSCKACLRRLVEAAQAAFVNVARGFSHRAWGRSTTLQPPCHAAGGLKSPALSCEACLRRLVEAAQVVQIGYLHEAEVRHLIEHPVKDFTLRYEPAASARIIALTRGHPYLVQLLCAEVVALKNTQDTALRRLARLEDVEAAVPEALASGDMFFADIAGNQIDAHGLALLRWLAAQGEGAVLSKAALARQAPEQLEPTLRQLLQRDLIESADGGYRFQVELIRRWFA